MKVLHYVNSFSPLSETFIYDYVTELERQGIDNYVLTNRRLNSQDRPFDKVSVVENPGRWHPERLLRRAGTIIRDEHPFKSSWPILRRRLPKEIKKINPDVIHAHFGPQGVMIADVAYSLNIPIVISFHGYDAFSLTKEQFWIGEYQKIDKVVSVVTCVSEYMRKYLSDIFTNANLEIVHVGKSLEGYPFKKPNGKVKDWLSIGRITEKKGHDDTIKAFEKILRINPSQKLRVVGDGEDIAFYQQLIDELDVSESITLLGALPHQEVKKELNNADAFILASKTAPNGDKEGIPTVLMEAQAIGLPCISTKHSGIPEVFPVRNQHFLSEEGNVEQLSKKMEKLINLTPVELGEIAVRGREKIEQDFNLTREVGKLINIYKKLI
jgi:glycosyltransferase involved in cell wall biosynthesis